MWTYRRTAKQICALILVTLSLSIFKVQGIETCISPTIPENLCYCFVNTIGGKEIDCRYKNLTEVPQFTPSNTVYEKISFGSIEASCEKCNKIDSISDYAFENLTVKYIDLINNRISSVSDYAFSGFNFKSHLLGIVLEGDGTAAPPYAALQALENTETLHLRNYRQTEMNGVNSRLLMRNLTTLTLEAFDGLSTIDETFFDGLVNPATIQTFHLKRMLSMTQLPVPAIHRLSGSLKKLEIEDTGITQIYGSSFSALNHLEELKIHQNLHLTNMGPESLLGLSDTLQFLDLTANKLSGSGSTGLQFLKQNWTKLSHLTLKLNENIGNIPTGSFNTFGTLDYLDIQDIGLTAVDSTTFAGLTNLHTLDISHNRISQVRNNAFQGCPSLVELRINNQQANEQPVTINFESSSFHGIESSLQHLLIEENQFDLPQFWSHIRTLTNLIELKIDSIGLTEIPDYALKYNTKLEIIWASKNSISQIKQETLYGPRDTLTHVYLSNNNLQTVDICVLNDFSRKPKLTITDNPLNCNCELVWLYNWMNQQPHPEDAALQYIGTCASPPNLQGKYFNKFNKSDMCNGDGPIANCPDLYTTTTTSTTTTSTTTTTTTTKAPIVAPDFDLTIRLEGQDYIDLTWTISDKTFVTGIRIDMTSNYMGVKQKHLHKEEVTYRFTGLRAGNFFTFCMFLELEGNIDETESSCKQGKTKSAADSTTTAKPTATEASGGEESNTPIIIGISIGAVVFVALVVVILYVVLMSNKRKHAKPPPPVSFTMHGGMHADIPQAGGTAKRHAKSADKGATPDDVKIQVISNGGLPDPARISAGSYQFLNQKGVSDKPMPSTSNGGYGHPANNTYGHYSNDMDHRPLPSTPGGLKWSGGANGHGYVNQDRRNMPETSTNQYSEVTSDSPAVI